MFNHDAINFQVHKVPLFVNDRAPDHAERLDGVVIYPGYTPPGAYNLIDNKIGVGIQREDTGQMLGIVSDAYEVVQYPDIVEQIEEALVISGIDMTDARFDTNVYNDGAQLELRARFPAHKQYLNERGDDVEPEFCFRTSQNRTWANNGMMGLWRSMCYNTLVSGDKLAYIYGRHTKNFNVPAFAAKIKGAAEYIASDGMAEMRTWYQTPVHREQAIDLFTKTLASRMDNVKREKVANKVMLSNLMKVFDEENRHLIGQGAYEVYSNRDEGTLWTAYQAATAWSTHVKKPNTKVMREDKVRKMLASDTWQQLAA